MQIIKEIRRKLNYRKRNYSFDEDIIA